MDEHLFRKEMGDVVPLKTAPTTDSKAPPVRHRQRRHETMLAQYAHTSQPPADNQTYIETDEGASHRKNGVQIGLMQKLKRGRFPLGGQLDLHSMNMVTAQTALLEFIVDAQNRTIECIRIIHGKGLRSDRGPRLKLMTRQILRNHPQVLAFTVCKPADGGSGAVDVLLKSI